MNVLGIETSCDDTSLALYATDRGLIETVTASQLIHDDFGGVVPRAGIAAAPAYPARSVRDAAGARRHGGVGHRRHRGQQRPRSHRIAAGRRGLRQVAGLGDWAFRSWVFTTSRPTYSPTELDGEALVYPCVVLIVSGGHTRAVPRARTGGNTTASATRAMTRPAKRSTRSQSSWDSGFPGGPVVQKAAEAGRADRQSTSRGPCAAATTTTSVSPG